MLYTIYMHFIFRPIISFIANALGLFLAGYLHWLNVPIDLSNPDDLKNLAIAAAVLTLINMFLRPLLRLVLSPLIVLTLGLGLIGVNALTLYILTKILPTVTISGLQPLLFATLLISVVNLVVKKIL